MANTKLKDRPWGGIALAALIILIGVMNLPSGSVATKMGGLTGVLLVAWLVYYFAAKRSGGDATE